MNPQKAYKFCLKCGGQLKNYAKYVLKCSSCGFKVYISPVPCNGVIILNKKNEIMLVKRKVEPKKGYWDLPGGFIQPDESLEQSVKREIKEELRINVKMDKIIGTYGDEYEFQNVLVPTLGIVVTAKPFSYKFIPKDDISSYKFFAPKDVLKQKLAFKSLRKGLKDYIEVRYT